jgi:hypothetical protein
MMMGIGNGEWGMGHWALGIGHWALGKREEGKTGHCKQQITNNQ